MPVICYVPKKFSAPSLAIIDTANEIIEEYAAAFRKASENYKELLPGDKKEEVDGKWGLTARKD